MILLREVVDQYLENAKTFGTPAELSKFAFSGVEVGRLFSDYDEDYQISRFLHFSTGEGEEFTINGFPATHVSIDAGIRSLL